MLADAQRVDATEEGRQPATPADQSHDDPAPGADDLGRDANDRVEEGAKLHAKQRALHLVLLATSSTSAFHRWSKPGSRHAAWHH